MKTGRFGNHQPEPIIWYHVGGITAFEQKSCENCEICCGKVAFLESEAGETVVEEKPENVPL